jgi:hypothetical protein
MIQETVIPTLEVSFKDFLFKTQRNRNILKIAAVAIIVQFSIFKYFYPSASFIHGDSFSYIEAAQQNSSINTYMIGYSKFLRLFSVLSSSDILLTAFQYVLLQASSLLLLFTLFYFHQHSRVLQYCLITFMIFNPLFLHLGNLVSSDCLFASASLIWFSILLWIIHHPSNKIIFLHSGILLIAFMLRYNALIYPLIAIIAFLLSPLQKKKKVIGVSAGLGLCLLFILYTSFQYKKHTGIWQYSPFSGWQIANNAMYAYRYVNKTDRKPVPKRFEHLDNMIRVYFDSTRNTSKYPVEKLIASTAYMWSPNLPLFKYREHVLKKNTTIDEFKRWAFMGPFYKDYGTLIIKKYPLYYIKYFIMPNATKYFVPQVEFLGHYNSNQDSVPTIAKNWFGYQTSVVQTRMENKKVNILNYYPILSGTSNVALLFCLISFLILKGRHPKNRFDSTILLLAIVWILNASFSIFASSVALRFQTFPILLSIVLTSLMIEWLVQLSFNKKIESSQSFEDKEKLIISY